MLSRRRARLVLASGVIVAAGSFAASATRPKPEEPSQPALIAVSQRALVGEQSATELPPRTGVRPATGPPASTTVGQTAPDRDARSESLDHAVARPPAVDSRFALDLFRSLSTRERNVNLVISPLGVANALKILHAGAKGRTATEIAAALHLTAEPTPMRQLETTVDRPKGHVTVGARTKTDPAVRPETQVRTDPAPNRANARTPEPCRLTSADSLWIQTGDVILPAFRNALESQTDVEVNQVDFTAGPAFRNPIELWAQRKAGRRISDVIGPLPANPMSMVLLSVIRFQARWRLQFPTQVTAASAFSVSPGLSVNVPMMVLKARLPYRADESFQVVELAYDDKLYSMVVLLPRSAGRLEDLEFALDADGLRSLVGGLERSTVQVFLPKFELAGSWQLQRDLERLRVCTPFSSDADFSGIDGTRRHRLSLLLHHASVRVDEAGTTADSVTSAMMVDKSLEQTTVFRADHPFIFLIKDNRNGDILFIGRVFNPAP